MSARPASAHGLIASARSIGYDPNRRALGGSAPREARAVSGLPERPMRRYQRRGSTGRLLGNDRVEKSTTYKTTFGNEFGLKKGLLLNKQGSAGRPSGAALEERPLVKRVQTPGGNASVSLGNDQVRYERPSEAVVSSSGQHTSAVLSLLLLCDRTKPLSLVPLPETVMSLMRKRLLALSHAIRKALAVKHTLSGVGFNLYWRAIALTNLKQPMEPRR